MKTVKFRRRDIILAAGALLTAPAVSAISTSAPLDPETAGAGADVPLWGKRTLRDQVTRPHFDRHVGERFDLVLKSGARVPAELVGSAKVRSEPRRRTLPVTPRQAFSVDFRAPAEPSSLADGVAWVEHASLGRMLLRRDLHLVPLGWDGSGYRYTAYFN